MVTALVLALAWLVGVPATAHAADDVVRRLDVTYAVQADGTVKVRQQLDWRFGESGRHGIQLGIAVRELWDADRTKDVVYGVTNLHVESPTGAPARFTEKRDGDGSVETLRVRVGDPDRTVDGRDQTYVVTYDLAGALRTFDGLPELFWDVTSEDFPRVEQFSVTVTAPGGVQRVRCLVAAACEADVVDAVARFSGSGIPRGQPLTVVAGLQPGAIAGAQPSLEPRRITSPVLVESHHEAQVRPDGTLHVEQRMSYLLPVRATGHRLTWRVPTRRIWSDREDQVLTVTNLRVSADGVEVPTSQSLYLDLGSTVWTSLDAGVPNSATADRVREVVLTYDVVGAVTTRGEVATVRWPFAGVALSEAQRATFVWHLPEPPVEVGCVRARRESGTDASCGRGDAPFVVAGRDVSATFTPETRQPDADWEVRLTLPGAAVGHIAPMLEPSRDHAERVATGVSFGGLVGSFVALFAGGWLVGRRPLAPDRRFVGVAPGTLNPDDAVDTENRGRVVVPVRFTPPETSLATAGALLAKRYEPAQLAATLVGMAVEGSITLRSKPFSVSRIEPPASGGLEQRLYEAADRRGAKDRELPVEQRRRMVTAARDHASKTLSKGRLVLPASAGWWTTGVRLVLVWLAGVLVALPVGLVLRWAFGANVPVVVFGAALGGALGLRLGRRGGPLPVLSARGTALRDQVVGFREYLATAEADQLDFEADQDIFTRYLPWAVLFDLTERWVRVCRQLADAGRIPALDSGSWAVNLAVSDVVRGVADLERAVARVPAVTRSSGSGGGGGGGFFSGGGSGGSSGFGGGFSGGGGGGGGTSASGW